MGSLVVNPADSRTELFRASWSLYETIIRANYMFHREIESAVRPVIHGQDAGRGYSILDLGCGNARGLAPILRVRPPARYVGVDLSRPALDEAALLLAGLPQVQLVEQDMLACVEELVGRREAFDVIHSAFALHHLETSDKARLFRAMSRALAPGGRLLLVDVVREPGQSREAYLENYLRMVETEWEVLDSGQVGEVRDHITAHDQPEMLEALAAMAREAGLTCCRNLAQYRQHAVVAFGRA